MDFHDPMPGVIENFNQVSFSARRHSTRRTCTDSTKLFFRGAVIASSGAKPWKHPDAWIDPGLKVHQTVQSKQVIPLNVFRSDLRWYAAAAVLELVTVLIVLPMFRGWLSFFHITPSGDIMTGTIALLRYIGQWTLGCNLSMSPFTVALAFDSTILKEVNSASGSKGVVAELGGVKLKFGVVDHLDEHNDLTGRPGYSRPVLGRLGVGKSENVVTPQPGHQFWE